MAASQAGLTRVSQRDFNARGAGRHQGPAPPLCFHGQPQSALTTLLTRPPLTTSDREYTPARSADRHAPIPSAETVYVGFRLAAVPEPSTYAMAFAGLACGGYSLFRRRRAR